MGGTLKKTCRWGVLFRNAFQMGHTRESGEKLVRSALFKNTFTWAVPIKSVFRWVVPLQNIFQMSGTFAKNVCRWVIPLKNISRWVVCSHEMFQDGWYLYKMCFQMGGTFTKYFQMGGTFTKNISRWVVLQNFQTWVNRCADLNIQCTKTQPKNGKNVWGYPLLYWPVRHSDSSHMGWAVDGGADSPHSPLLPIPPVPLLRRLGWTSRSPGTASQGMVRGIATS